MEEAHERELILADDHSALLHFWRQRGRKGRKLLHLDSHCDLRGGVFDGNGYLRKIAGGRAGVDQGNFLLHAGLEGWVDSVRWVHDGLGGRARDIGTFWYEHELERGWGRLASRWYRPAPEGTRLRIEVVPYRGFRGWMPGEELDIDWDFFAAEGRGAHELDELVREFLSQSLGTPQIVYLVASSEFSTPWSQSRYWDLVTALSTRMGVTPRVLETPWRARPRPDRLALALRHLARRSLIHLKQLLCPLDP